jgi:cell division protein FtsW
MTLPFISYGGSSMISLAYGVGMMLALTRLRSRTEILTMGDTAERHSYA